MFPGVQCGIGPPTDEGFFYDFVVPRPFVPEDLEAIENEDARVRGSGPRSTSGRCGRARRPSVLRQSRRTAQGPIDRGEDRRVRARSPATRSRTRRRSSTSVLARTCRRPGKLKAFKLLTTSNAYWKGDARNQPMQRVYGTAFLSEKDLKASPHAHRGSEEARPPEARPRAEALHVPPVGAGRDVLAREGHAALQHARRLHARTCSSLRATPR